MSKNSYLSIFGLIFGIRYIFWIKQMNKESECNYSHKLCYKKG